MYKAPQTHDDVVLNTEQNNMFIDFIRYST